MSALFKFIRKKKREIMASNRNFFGIIVFFVIAFFSACSEKSQPLFEALSSSKTNISFTNKLEKHKAFNILYYLYYYNGGGVATGDIFTMAPVYL